MPGLQALSFVERRITRSYIRFVCLLVLAVYGIVFFFSFSTAAGGRTFLGPNLGADFGAFYVAGKIFNTHSPAQIYETELQDRLYRELFPPDMEEASRKSAAFFVTILGGPPLYFQKYGSPRMRARHLPFEIDERARQIWLECFELDRTRWAFRLVCPFYSRR